MHRIIKYLARISGIGPGVTLALILNFSGYACVSGTSLLSGSGVRQNAMSIADNPFRYTGYYTDLETGLNYLKARYYSPRISAFISRDTYDLQNRYAYCEGNPVMNSDPGGHAIGQEIAAEMIQSAYRYWKTWRPFKAMVAKKISADAGRRLFLYALSATPEKEREESTLIVGCTSDEHIAHAPLSTAHTLDGRAPATFQCCIEDRYAVTHVIRRGAYHMIIFEKFPFSLLGLDCKLDENLRIKKIMSEEPPSEIVEAIARNIDYIAAPKSLVVLSGGLSVTDPLIRVERRNIGKNLISALSEKYGFTLHQGIPGRFGVLGRGLSREDYARMIGEAELNCSEEVQELFSPI